MNKFSFVLVGLVIALSFMVSVAAYFSTNQTAFVSAETILSIDFGNVLVKFIPALVRADFSVPTKDLVLPDEVKNAIIVHNGQLTERFAYLARHLPKSTSGGER